MYPDQLTAEMQQLSELRRAVKAEFESLGHGEAVRASAAVYTVCAVKAEFESWDMEKRCV
jgi:hypothetical protein